MAETVTSSTANSCEGQSLPTAFFETSSCVMSNQRRFTCCHQLLPPTSHPATVQLRTSPRHVLYVHLPANRRVHIPSQHGIQQITKGMLGASHAAVQIRSSSTRGTVAHWAADRLCCSCWCTHAHAKLCKDCVQSCQAGWLPCDSTVVDPGVADFNDIVGC